MEKKGLFLLFSSRKKEELLGENRPFMAPPNSVQKKKEIYEKYADMFNFKERMVKQMTGRKSKQDNIVNFLNGNVGKVVTPVQLATDVQISLPTFYNFYNANRGYFKKVKRGHFEILNPKEERVSI